jgi:hypothetical protein
MRRESGKAKITNAFDVFGGFRETKTCYIITWMSGINR